MLRAPQDNPEHVATRWDEVVVGIEVCAVAALPSLDLGDHEHLGPVLASVPEVESGSEGSRPPPGRAEPGGIRSTDAPQQLPLPGSEGA